MGDLISREDVKDILSKGEIVLDEDVEKCESMHEVLVYLLYKVDEFVQKSVDEIPAVDAVPVMHGEWLRTTEPLGWEDVKCIECSACHENWIEDEFGIEDFKMFWRFCPKCGARMDGKRNKNLLFADMEEIIDATD